AASIRPVAPAGSPGAPATGSPAGPGGSLELRDGKGGLTQPVSLVLLLGGLSLVPGMLIMITAFTRIVIVMGLTRSALGTQGTPPNQVLIGLSLFLTLFVMGPALSQANEQAVQPFLHDEITQSQAFERGLEPFREFMLKQVREQDLSLFVELSDKTYANESEVPITTIIPAYVISELRAAFLIGFIIFIPFLVIDLVVSAALSAMGMAMLPPSLVSLPFKLLLFVAVDGWYLLVSSLVRSFHMT
ncbi:MAG: flagellar biosynthetic protein FliP, partial [Frankiales bacterium]|nr:flagellar biosynthetic protein FliP [Frankiales bacterium]